MSASDKTTNYNLPIFLGSDIPSWLEDFNGSMDKIDTAIKSASETGGITKQYVDDQVKMAMDEIAIINETLSNIQTNIINIQQTIATAVKVGTTKEGITATQYDNLTT